MKKTVKILALVLSMVFVLGCFAGCGEKKPVDGNDGTTAPVAKPTSALLADGKLTVGTNAEFPPFEFLGDDGKPDGFDIALIKAIGAKMGVEVEVLDMEFDSLCTSVGSKVDVAIAGMTVDAERLETVDFSDSYYKAIQNVLVAAGNEEIKDFDSLSGKKIGVQLGTTGDFIATDDVKNAEVKQYKSFALAVEDLKNGNLDAVIVDQNPAQVFASENPDTIKLIGAEAFAFEDEYYAIACPKGDTALVYAINSALAELQTSGEFDALVKEYIEK